MIYGLGPRARRVYAALHDRIVRGGLAPGTRLPSHRELATEFGVAPLTVRQVLSHLEERGLVSREVGRGTFVRQPTLVSILIVDGTPSMGAFLADYVGRAGYHAITASCVADAFETLANDPAIVLILCDLRVPTPAEGVRLIEAVRRRWPDVPAAAMITELDDLAGLFGAAEWPLLVLPKPISLGLLDELLRLIASRSVAAPD